MLRNGQRRVCILLRQFNIMCQRDYAAKGAKTKSATAQRNTINTEIFPITPVNNTLEVPIEQTVNANFLMRTVGATYRKWTMVLQKYPELKSLKRKDIVNTTKVLKKLDYDAESILSKPMILYQNALTIDNRHIVLQECGVQPIPLALLSKYVTVINKTVVMLKSYGYVNFDLDMIERLRTCFTDIDIQKSVLNQCNEQMELKLLREHILNYYLRLRLDMNNSDIEKLWKVYGRIRHRSFQSVQQIVQVLLEELQFPKQRIIKNAYLLYADPENVRRILREIKTIDGQDIREIVYKRPKILMSTCDALQQTLEYIKSFGIGEDAVIRCLEVLTLGPDTVLERLRDLNAIKEFQVLGTNPRVLRLVHYQNKARLRLQYLNHLKVRCASLHILSGGSEKFAKFAQGSDRTKGSDIVVYLANVMAVDEQKIRDLISRHPNWCHVPVLQVKQCFDLLCSKKFPIDAIFDNIHLLLYPIKRIEEKLIELQSQEMLDYLRLNIKSTSELSNNEYLTLILYLIECEFHFTGDGIWTDQHLQPVENFNNLLPDFPESPNKVYKYGVKPAAGSCINTETESARRAQQLLLQGV